MTRGEIRDAVITSLRESPVPVRWSTDELNHYIDDGYVHMAELTGAVVRTTTLSCPPGQHFISLPSDCLYVIAAKDQVSDLPLDPVHWSFLDEVDLKWITVSSARPDMFAMFGLREIVLYPAYETTSTIEIIIATVPDGFTSDNDIPDLPEEYHHGLAHYAHGRSIIKDAHGDEAGPRIGRARRQFAFYQMAINGLGKWTFDRHKHIFKATYGERFRMPELDTYGVELN